MMNNSELLFIYDAKLCNPNGDPDEENRPRMDYERDRNLVSDLRLKRYIRDYLEQKGYEIFVTKPEGKTVNATQRLNVLIDKYGKKININKLTEEDINWILSELVDVRLFGATMPIKSQESKGSSQAFTGPVQFNWGYSLNNVKLVESNGITTHFSAQEDKTQGTMGKDYRVYYSLIAFNGIISGYRAKYTNMTDEDLKLFEEALIKSIPLLATRSKIGQYPRLYIRAEYNDSEYTIGDFRDYISLVENEELREISDFKLDITRLADTFKEKAGKIKKIYVWQDEKLNLVSHQKEGAIDTLLDIPNVIEKLVL